MKKSFLIFFGIKSTAFFKIIWYSVDEWLLSVQFNCLSKYYNNNKT